MAALPVMRRPVAVVSLLGAVLFVACAGAESGQHGAVEVSALVTGQPNAVEVRGLGRATVRRLTRLAPNDSIWPRLLAVYVERDAADTLGTRGASPTPAVLGRYVPSDDRLRFEPRFAFAEGVRYRVEVDTAALATEELLPAARQPRPVAITYRFAIPAVAQPRMTRVTGVFPSSATLPSNVLRWYVETSAPMEPGNALQHVRLMDESGREISGAFLPLDQELWDPERRRLTLLFDPGRVKRGIRTNLESGAPLVAGRRYRLVIDAGWTDGVGAPLASGYEFAFDVAGADRRSPDPDRWRLTTPPAGTHGALQVAFGESLDHALAARLLMVVDSAGGTVPGSVDLRSSDSVWVFTPQREWVAGAYVLRVGGALEDVAGNNIVRVFDVDRRLDSAGVDRDVAGASRSVHFRIGPAR